MDLVGEADGSLGVDAELILGVGEDQAALGGQALAAGEEREGGFAYLPPLIFKLTRPRSRISSAVSGSSWAPSTALLSA